jgi:hypothetical protein
LHVAHRTVEAVGVSDDVQPDANVSRFLLFGAYGEVMLRFQLLEMSYWQILAARRKRGVQLHQGMQKVEGWERQTGERLIKALGLPDELYDEANTAVNTRNYLAHAFLRDRAPFLGVEGAAEAAVGELAQVSAKLDEFEGRLETYMRDVGVPELSEDELKQLGLDVALDPAEWLTEQTT